MSLKERYNKLVEEYGKVFEEIIEDSGEWNTDHNVWLAEERAFGIDEVRFIVDTYKDKPEMWQKVRSELYEWEEYTQNCITFGIQFINIQSWFRGAPRMSSEAIARLKACRAELETLIKEQQEKHGEYKEDCVPSHLR